MRKKNLLAILVCIVGLCTLTGCTEILSLYRSAVQTPVPTKVAQPTRARPPTLTAQGTDSTDSQPVEAYGTLRLLGGLPPTLDPAMAQDSTSALYIVHIFSGLVTLNSSLEVVPDLAESWDVSPDRKTYTFHLNPAATFQDGRAITSADLVYSLERACSPETASPVASSYLEDIVGVAEFASGQADTISGLDAPDDNTLVITIDAPKAYFLAKLTYPAAFVVDRQQIESQGSNWFRQPNGSGPFVLKSITAAKIVLERNELYYGKLPGLAQVEFTMGGGTPMTMYENDQLEIVGVPPSEIERVLDPSNPLSAEFREESELSVQYLALTTTRPPFDDIAVRQAFAMAIDRVKIADLVLKGTASAAKGILPPTMPGFDPTLEGLAYDPAKARELLASSSYGAPGAMPEVVLTISGTSGHMDGQTRAIVFMLETNLGISITVEQVDWSDFLNDMNNEVYQFYSSGWIADYPDPQNFLDIQFHSKSQQNHTGYANPQVDDLLEQARTAFTPEERYSLYHQAERLIVNDAAWIPLTHGVDYALVKPYIRGYVTTSSIYPWLRDITIAD
ncbi:MAG: peptide ABC transporter substrate-binding protein [Anaerolineae bacterium]